MTRLGSAIAILPLLLVTVVAAQGLPAGLDPEPVTAEPLGLQFHPPAGATFQYQRVGEEVSLSLVDGAPVPTWTMRIQTMTTPGRAGTPEDHVRELLAAWRKSGRPLQVIADEHRTVDGADAHLAYIRTETAAGPAVHGWLVATRPSGDLLAFALEIDPTALAVARASLDRSFETIKLYPPDTLANRRIERIEMGRAVLARLTEERLRTLVGHQRHFRYFLPAGDGRSADQELGYYEIRISEDRLGEIDPTQPEHLYDPTEEERGLLVRVAGHYLQEGSDLVYDSEAFYWLAWDRSREAWSIRGTHRQGRKTQSDALTGIRTEKTPSDPHGTITVISSHRDGTSRDQKTWRTPEVYMSQATRWMIGRLLVACEQREAIAFSTYCFDHTATKLSLSLRLDEWTPTAQGFRLVSRTRGDAPTVTSDYDTRGQLVRRVWETGPVSEAIEPDKLRRLWSQKGLTSANPQRGSGR